jgi:hypothetical protein
MKKSIVITGTTDFMDNSIQQISQSVNTIIPENIKIDNGSYIFNKYILLLLLLSILIIIFALYKNNITFRYIAKMFNKTKVIKYENTQQDQSVNTKDKSVTREIKGVNTQINSLKKTIKNTQKININNKTENDFALSNEHINTQLLKTKTDNIPKPNDVNNIIKKKGYCYIGEDRNFRSCVKVSQHDICMSGDIFPTREICINPNLRI